MVEDLVEDHEKRVLKGLFVGFILLGVGMVGYVSGLVLSDLALGLIGGITAFLIVALVYLTLLRVSEVQLRILQGIFLVLAVVYSGARLSAGESVLLAAWQGLVVGGLSFIPLIVVFSIIFLAYWVGTQRSISLGHQ